ncbi:MAG: sterol desaturase family protein [Deltaproteobacteria bacterium]|nr:sterol desaturase family protein [Deltaproteobacteria bacterium]
MTPALAGALAALLVFFLADLVYTVDHYLVHRDRRRYKVTHSRHHRRYNRAKDAPQLDAYELSTYTTAGVMLMLGASLVTLFTGNLGFFLGAVFKYAHSLLFHLYQHAWWGPVHVRKLMTAPPRRTWGIASARYHAWHHAHPDDGPFTYSETWAGFDRILELLDPWLSRHTVDGREGAGEHDGRTP